MSMEVDEPQTLQFKESLTGTQKAPELTRKLKDLHEELRQLEQVSTDKESLRSVADQLIHKQILEHSNGTVKVLAGCCIADIFRLYAPDQPYNKANLKRVFAFFASQLALFEKKNNTYEYRFYLLESLSTVKSIIILGDLDRQAEEMANTFFFNFFKVSENKDVGNNVKLCMTEILIQIIEEVGILSQECVELILEQFGKYDKESTDGPYQMAFEICRSCPNVIQRRVCQYFSDVILAVSRSESSDDEIEELRKTHDLIRKVYSILPELLLNVLPQLQEEMSVDEDNVRQIATETIGKMLADSQSNLVEQYPALWKAWLGRRNDKTINLRLKWLDMVEEIMQRHPELVNELNDCLKSKLADPEEKIRAATCRLIGELQTNMDIRNVDKDLLQQTSERTKDKKASVRREAMNAMGSIYNHFFDQERVTMEKIGWIPTTVVNRLYVGDASVTVALEAALQDFILPEIEDDKERVERLVTVVSSLDEKAAVAFVAILRKQKAFMEQMQGYVEICESNNIDEHQQSKNDEFMKHLAAIFPDKARTLNSLRSFLSSCSKKEVKLLKTAINPDADYKTVYSSKKSLLETLNETDGAVAEIFTALLNKASPTIINKSSIPALLALTKTSRGRKTASNQKAAVAQELLKEISESYPTMYKSYLKELIKGISSDGNTPIVDESLAILAGICKSSSKKTKFDKDVVNQLIEFVKEGSLSQAEDASIILANALNIVNILNTLIEELSLSVELASPRLSITLCSLAKFAEYCPEAITSEMDTLIYFVEKDLLNAPSPEVKNKKENNLWCTFDQLPLPCQEKVLGVRLIASYLKGCEKLPGSGEEFSSLIFPILWSLLDRTCDAAVADNTIAAESSHLRLAAAKALVTLTETEKFGTELTIEKFEKLSLIAQDSCFYVRLEFAETLMKALQAEQLHPRFFAALFLFAHEPEVALIKQIKTFIHNKLSDNKTLGVVLAHLLHILAHHPDFSVSMEDLSLFSQYIKFYLSCVATATNISYLYHTAQKIKLSKDAISEELSDNSYVLSDLTSLLIKTKCKEANWPLNALGERLIIHPKLYRPLPVGAVQSEIIKKSYLPSTFIQKYEEDHSHKLGEKRTRSLAVASAKRPKL